MQLDLQIKWIQNVRKSTNSKTQWLQYSYKQRRVCRFYKHQHSVNLQITKFTGKAPYTWRRSRLKTNKNGIWHQRATNYTHSHSSLRPRDRIGFFLFFYFLNVPRNFREISAKFQRNRIFKNEPKIPNSIKNQMGWRQYIKNVLCYILFRSLTTSCKRHVLMCTVRIKHGLIKSYVNWENMIWAS